jgi:hypothetical protein
MGVCMMACLPMRLRTSFRTFTFLYNAVDDSSFAKESHWTNSGSKADGVRCCMAAVKLEAEVFVEVTKGT